MVDDLTWTVVSWMTLQPVMGCRHGYVIVFEDGRSGVREAWHGIRTRRKTDGTQHCCCADMGGMR